MPRLKMTLEDTTKDGERINFNHDASGGGGSHHYDLIEPGTYPAILEQLQTLKDTEEVFGTKAGEILKLRPSIVLLNDNETTINRQDFKVGLYDPKTQTLYSNNSNSVVWGNIQGARNLLRALALFAELGNGKFSLDLNTDLVVNRVIKVLMGIGGYVRGNYDYDGEIRDPRNLAETLKELNSGVKWTISDIPELVRRWNASQGLSEDDGLQVKNVVINAFYMDEWEAEERGYYRIDEEIAESVGGVVGQVFVDEGDFEHYMEMSALDGEEGSW